MILSKRLSPERRRTFWIVLAAGLALAVLFMVSFAEIHEDLSQQNHIALDEAILEGIHAHDTPALTVLARTLSFIGSPVLLVPVILVVAAVLWTRGMKRDGLLLVLSVGGAALVDTALKLHYKRIRPEVPWAFVQERSFSFPSGHSVGAVVLYGILTYLLIEYRTSVRERVGLVVGSVLLVAGIGLSRIYLGVHYPSDVVAGYLVGGVWLLAVMGADWSLRRPAHS